MSANFGDILNQWEAKHGSGIVDKDAADEKAALQKKMQSRRYIDSLKPQAVLDLHGSTQDEAWKKLNDFVQDARRRGLQKVMIIHGKGIHSQGGDGVLGEVVRKFIEYDQRLGASGKADREHGGSGATWVVVRN